MKNTLRLLLLSVLLAFSAAGAATWYVDDSVGSSGDGTSWATAFKTIQQGIIASSNGDEVLVKQGTYIENIAFGGKNITLRSTDPTDWNVVKGTIIDANNVVATVTFAGTENDTCVLSGFTIRNGKGADGGGVRGGTAAQRSHAVITNNIIVGNSAQNGGGLAYCDGVIGHNFIYGNSASNSGGALYDCDGIIESNVIVGNSASSGGGLNGCGGNIRNNTVCLNSCSVYGGGALNCPGATVNCIFWGNTAGGGGAQVYGSMNVSYCCVQGGAVGTGNIADDPLFMDRHGPDDDPQTYEDNDYRLWVGSLCVDSGTNQEWMNEAVDLEGNPRLLQGRVSLRVDMGAYEHVPTGLTSQPWYVDDSVGSSGDGKSWATAFKKVQEAIDAASDAGDTVTVAQGIYHENVNFNGKNIVLQSINPKDWRVVRQTVIDGGQAGATVTFAGTEDETCVLSGFTIRNGKGTNGGGICGWTDANSTHATIENNIIAGNSAQYGGGLAFCDGVVRNNFIYGNSASNNGGGVYKCDNIVESNVIVGNSASGGGGLSDCSGEIRNNTVCQNSCSLYGGGAFHCWGAIVNCIFWGNTAGSGGPQSYSSSVFSYSCVQGGTGGTANIADDPLFMDPDGPDDDPQTYGDNDYRLWVGSLCVDSGTNQEWMNEAVDLDGNPRLLQGRVSLTVDRGAYEHVSTGPTSQPWYVDDSVSSSGDGKSWEAAFKTIQEGIDAASDAGDTVTVAQGVYHENVNLNGKNIVLHSISPKDWEVVGQTVIVRMTEAIRAKMLNT